MEQQQAEKSPITDEGNVITIENDMFSPAEITVRQGEVLNIVNKSDEDHTFTADDDSFDTEDIEAGEEMAFEVDVDPGQYPYHCEYHPEMKGTLIVEATEE